jgi:hypothetical protein
MDGIIIFKFDISLNKNELYVTINEISKSLFNLQNKWSPICQSFL